MALVDADRDEIVIRILYDGPPLAGKTTNLKALVDILAARRRSDLFTPAEVEGRTLYFDWMDYLGGWFDGNQVRCQIVAAPGQRSLAKRRHALRRDADVVVLVLEATPHGAGVGVAYFEELLRSLQGSCEVPVPVVVQANKQDLAGALSEDELRRRLRGWKHVAILGASAASGAGVREVFTFAVRLALDRVRALQGQGALEVGVPPVRSGEDLLAWMERFEAEDSQPVSTPIVEAVREGEPASMPRAKRAVSPASARREPAEPHTGAPASPDLSNAPDGPALGASVPALPTSKVASGLVWPPITGRVILHEGERASLVVRRDDDGSWSAAGHCDLRLESRAEDVYADLEQGRNALLRVARDHASLAEILSDEKALALAETGDGCWRLWRIHRYEPSLLDRLMPLLQRVDAGGAEKIFRLADALIRADGRFRAVHAPLGATLANVGISNGAPCYVGALAIAPEREAPPDEVDPADLVRREFGPHLSRASRDGAVDGPSAVTRLRGFLETRPERAAVIESLTAMLIGS